MKILIVDDSKTILLMVSEMLKKLGHEPLTAIHGQDAFDVVSKNTDIDIILLDWNMPVMTGIEFLVKNKNEKIFDIPIMMMTTEKAPDKIKMALENGAVDYIMKPFTPDVLNSKIEMLKDFMD